MTWPEFEPSSWTTAMANSRSNTITSTATGANQRWVTTAHALRRCDSRGSGLLDRMARISCRRHVTSAGMPRTVRQVTDRRRPSDIAWSSSNTSHSISSRRRSRTSTGRPRV